jgi:hypothetical protein
MRKDNMLSKQDYRLMAGAFRKVYLSSRSVVYHDNGEVYRTVLREFMAMLAEDNPRFRRDYFMNYIIHGTERPKSPSGVHHAEA